MGRIWQVFKNGTYYGSLTEWKPDGPVTLIHWAPGMTQATQMNFAGVHDVDGHYGYTLQQLA